ncbi:unnamed protein product [Cylicocyclus nassatus]|uniref:Uncharacterized protein n=1 Tax=Cylicocyclus nassatus TaxID=53992 RepID=A0AA36M6Y5_CYLNA|nr:unnamed protein product [Cylicocyclus nassatus]
MAIIWFVVLVLFTQAFRALSCAFDRVETLTGRMYHYFTDSNENDCFAKCFEYMACTGIGYRKMSLKLQIKRSKFP